jgi:hypothetical protein
LDETLNPKWIKEKETLNPKLDGTTKKPQTPNG